MAANTLYADNELHPDTSNATGTVVSASSSQVVLPAALSPSAIGYGITITGGTGAGQSRRLTSNIGSFYSIDVAWTTIPDGSSTFEVVIGADTNNGTTATWDGVNGPVASIRAGFALMSTDYTLSLKRSLRDYFDYDPFQSDLGTLVAGESTGWNRLIAHGSNSGYAVINGNGGKAFQFTTINMFFIMQGVRITNTGSTRLLGADAGNTNYFYATDCQFDNFGMTSAVPILFNDWCGLHGCYIHSTDSQDGSSIIQIDNGVVSDSILSVSGSGSIFGLILRGSGPVTNCLIFETGSAVLNFGIYSSGGATHANGCTFYGSGSYGIYHYSSLPFSVSNCIFGGSFSWALHGATAGSKFEDYNCIDTGVAIPRVNWPVGANTIIADPKFANVAANDYRLQEGSPCRHIGWDPGRLLAYPNARTLGAFPMLPRLARPRRIAG